jgi:hypothetical protein
LHLQGQTSDNPAISRGQSSRGMKGFSLEDVENSIINSKERLNTGIDFERVRQKAQAIMDGWFFPDKIVGFMANTVETYNSSHLIPWP